MSSRQHLALSLAAMVVTGGIHAQGEVQKAQLKFRALKNFNCIMPLETWNKVSGSIALPHARGEGFVTRKDGVKLHVDTDGDGKTDDFVQGVGGYLRFKSKKDGETFQYAVRFKGGNGTYTSSTSCSMTGSVGGVPIQLFDLNGNGQYNEVGTDGLIVGKGKAASYFGEIISFKDKLYKLTADAAG